MRLTKVYVRFYKSFNYDYERKAHPEAVADPWEDLDGAWYPFVRVAVEPSITTVVGANESGKSHLLDAIEHVITGNDVERSDFCRYSEFFSVEQGKMRIPDFGAEFELSLKTDAELVKTRLGLEIEPGKRFHVFRLNGGSPVVYLPGDKDATVLDANQAKALFDVLPSVFRLRSNVPLPDSIPLRELNPDARSAFADRRRRGTLLEALFGRSYANAEAVKQNADAIYGAMSDGVAGGVDKDVADQRAQYELGRALVFVVAKIDPKAIKDLDDAIADAEEGYVNGVVQKINEALARHLNFPRWWAQDREFRLLVSPREYELVFTIRDRTGTDYSFKERSSGLKYFLSYYVQLLAHRPPISGQPEILLMDEPDAYLSSQGQQDLLRILEEFALPEDRQRSDQVVYVTHSPFLINRNAGGRIRVLDKGTGEEGTRVVRDVARNHYEPLRSSLGAFVAETAFIGGSNLFVEGLADQVLLAGISSHLRASGSRSLFDTLDLNEVTIVPAGSAESIPYLIFLARGRDQVRPPCVALFDGDKAGVDAAAELLSVGPKGKTVLPAEFVLEISEWTGRTAGIKVSADVVVREPEDLIPVQVAVAAARRYAQDVLGMLEAEATGVREKDVLGRLPSLNGSMWDAVRATFKAAIPDGHIEKVGFVKEVVSHVVASRNIKPRPEGVAAIEENFAQLLTELTTRLRKAKLDEDDRRQTNRLGRLTKAFLDDHKDGTTRDRGRLLLNNVLGALEDSSESDPVRLEVGWLRRTFKLDEDLAEPIPDFTTFREKVKALRLLPRFANQEPLEKDAVRKPRPAPKLARAGKAASAVVEALPSDGPSREAESHDPSVSKAD